jgi:hypothetical protein
MSKIRNFFGIGLSLTTVLFSFPERISFILIYFFTVSLLFCFAAELSLYEVFIVILEIFSIVGSLVLLLKVIV